MYLSFISYPVGMGKNKVEINPHKWIGVSMFPDRVPPSPMDRSRLPVSISISSSQEGPRQLTSRIRIPVSRRPGREAYLSVEIRLSLLQAGPGAGLWCILSTRRQEEPANIGMRVAKARSIYPILLAMSWNTGQGHSLRDVHVNFRPASPRSPAAILPFLARHPPRYPRFRAIAAAYRTGARR